MRRRRCNVTVDPPAVADRAGVSCLLRLTVPLLDHGWPWYCWWKTRRYPACWLIYGLPALGAVHTLVTKTYHEAANVLDQDWLGSAGLAVYWGAAVALPPTAHWLIATHPELVVAYEVKALS
jgi:hypothetical protein